MSIVIEEAIKRWTARRKATLVLDIIQGEATVPEASRQFDLLPSETESGVEDGKRGWRTRCGPSQRMCASSTSGS